MLVCQLSSSQKRPAHSGVEKTFYDRHYDGDIEKSKQAAIAFRDSVTEDFFRQTDYDPTLRERQKAHARFERERPKKKIRNNIGV